MILLKSNGDETITITRSRVIMDQLQKVKKEFLVNVELERRNKYFTFG